MTQPRMTKSDYVKCAGTRCPYCLSFSTARISKPQECEDGKLRSAFRCDECGGRWREVYKLVGYEEL